MPDAPLTLGTAGHIDHGKTALVRALTGKDTDRLPEEAKRGISIELGYAQLDLPSGRGLSVVDVPGHERFVRTMVAGATGIDLFLMCIAADDGVMPQTREHLTVLRRLGLEHGVVAITKADAADPEIATGEARELIPDVEVVPVSALRGDGLDDLLGALDRAAATTASRGVDAANAPARLHVDRSFTLKGIGTVVTGTLWSGSIAAGESVDILPSGASARVRSVQVHDRPLERAVAGQRVALNLVGVRRQEVARGDVIVRGAVLSPAFIADIRMELEPGVRLDPGSRLHVHHGTREAPGRLYPLGEDYAQLRLEAPIVALSGDRLILRRLAPPDTIGGGVVVESPARRHGPRREVVARLAAIEDGADPGEIVADAPATAANVEIATERAAPTAADPRVDRLRELLRADGPRPRTDNELAEAAGLDAADAGAAWRQLEGDGLATRVGRTLHFDPAALEELAARIVAVCERDGSATIASVRDELDTSRKYAQALLEHLDATRVTLRRGDLHVLRHAQR